MCGRDVRACAQHVRQKCLCVKEARDACVGPPAPPPTPTYTHITSRQVSTFIPVVVVVVVVVLVVVVVVVVHGECDIDPGDPLNMTCLRAPELTHAAPHSMRLKDVAP